MQFCRVAMVTKKRKSDVLLSFFAKATRFTENAFSNSLKEKIFLRAFYKARGQASNRSKSGLAIVPPK
jgi:hypothetical protein